MKNNFNLGDMPKDEFLEFSSKLTKIITDYLYNIEKYPVLPKIAPGDCYKHFSAEPPQTAVDFSELLSSIEPKIFNNATHWNHPGFMAYFNSTSSGPGILAEFLTAALNTNGMVWKSSPINTELETVVVNWMKQMLGLPNAFWGIIYDTASVSTFHALAAAREKVFQDNKNYDLNINSFTVYISEHTHSSAEKGALALGIRKIRKIKSNNNYEIDLTELEETIKKDLQNNLIPMAAVATIGTTAVTSIDDVISVSSICKKYNIWLHVDSAHAGIAAIADEYKHLLNGVELADSIVVNPHKWMFTPTDLSLLFIKEKHYLKDAFSIIPEYLRSNIDDQVENSMDYGIQLGRRFRALKLWFIISYFGVEGIQNRIKEHFRLADIFKTLIENNPIFERMAPMPVTTICFRALIPNCNEVETINNFNLDLIDKVNDTGKFFLSHTKINGNVIIRVVISSLRVEEKHVMDCYNTFVEQYKKLLSNKNR